jgi:hypothetical protein
MTGISGFADTVIRLSVGVLALAAAVVVVVGIVNVVRARRREQIVVADIADLVLSGPDRHAAAPSLSPWLRQRVRGELLQQRGNARHLTEKVLGEDLATGLSPLALPVELSPARTEAAISGAAQDTLATLAQGLQAVAPQRTEGFLGALSTLLPRARGYLVRAVPMARGDETNPRLGISVELALLDGPPIATRTFWEPAPTAATPQEMQERLLSLIDPAARWIAIRLIAARTEVRTRKPTPGDPNRYRMPAETAAGFHHLLVGGLCRTAMDDFEDHAATFAEDADAELRSASDVLPRYHRPWEMLADVYEELGRNYTKNQRTDLASAAFKRAYQAWGLAERMLMARNNPPPDELAGLRVRRLKSRVLANRAEGRPAVIQELADQLLDLDAMEMRTLYNTGCLYATLDGEFVEEAKAAVGRAMLIEPDQDVRSLALHDPELLAISGLATFLNRLATLRPSPPERVRGEEALKLITAANE